jgi:hypothetical protein
VRLNWFDVDKVDVIVDVPNSGVALAVFGKGIVRADGRKIHDAYLNEVKKPAEAKYPGDFYKTARPFPRQRRSAPSRMAGVRSSMDEAWSRPALGNGPVTR